MRLVYLDPHSVPDDIPEALQILYTVDALGEIGVDVTLVTPSPRRRIAADHILGRPISSRVTFHYLPDLRKRWWFPFASNKPFYFLAARALRKLQADVVFVRNLKMAEYLLRETPQIPLIFETHEVFAQTYREEHPTPTARQRYKLGGLEQREAFVYEHAAGLLALTPLLLDDIRSTYGVTVPGEIAPDGVDLKQAEAPLMLPQNTGVPMLLYLGSLHPWKGVDTLIRAMKHVTRGAQLTIVGGNSARIAELRALAASVGVGNKVIFVGPVEPGRRFEWIHRADVCLLPLTATSIGSRYTSPLKLFEYLAAGKPIVVSDLPSMRAVLEHDKHAVLVEDASPEGFATAIERLLAQPALRTRLGNAAREHAKNFTWKARAERIQKFASGLKR